MSKITRDTRQSATHVLYGNNSICSTLCLKVKGKQLISENALRQTWILIGLSNIIINNIVCFAHHYTNYLSDYIFIFVITHSYDPGNYASA